MQKSVVVGCVIPIFSLAASLPAAAAAATIVQPAIGVVATEAFVSSAKNTLVVGATTGTGSGVSAAYFGTTSSSVSAGLPSFGLSGYAAADLATGQLHFAGASSYLASNFQAVGAVARFSDIITITGSISAPIIVRLTLTGHGSVTGTTTDNQFSFSNIDLDAQTGAGDIYSNLGIGYYDGSKIQYEPSSRNGTAFPLTNGTSAGYTSDAGGATNLSFSVYTDVLVSDSNRTISFNAEGAAGPGSGVGGYVAADFGNTANLGLTLPTGLGFTSASGVLLSQPQIGPPGPSPVPEPTSATLLAVGLTGVYLYRRRSVR